MEKDLNQILRECSGGGKTYYTTPEVIKYMVDTADGAETAVINPPYERKTMTQRDMMRQTARNLCRLLKRYNIEATPDERITKVEKTLRYCWYVPRIKEMGYNECIYINMPKGMGFFIVTETCEVLTASNIMILDAIQDVLLEVGYDDDVMDAFLRFKWRGRPEYEGSEHGIMVVGIGQLERAIRYMVLNTMYKGMPEFELYFDHKKDAVPTSAS